MSDDLTLLDTHRTASHRMNQKLFLVAQTVKKKGDWCVEMAMGKKAKKSDTEKKSFSHFNVVFLLEMKKSLSSSAADLLSSG